MTRIYTRTGDDGTTGLIGGARLSKDSPRLEAYGSIDELNSWLGLVCGHPLPESVAGVLRRVQDELFTVAAQLALPEGNSGRDWGIAGIGAEAVAALEKDIDYCEGELTPLREFILPGGAVAAALLHVARTVARRAERACVALARVDAVDSNVLSYMNRLSDLCFVLARLVNARAGQAEAHPTFGR